MFTYSRTRRLTFEFFFTISLVSSTRVCNSFPSVHLIEILIIGEENKSSNQIGEIFLCVCTAEITFKRWRAGMFQNKCTKREQIALGTNEYLPAAAAAVTLFGGVERGKKGLSGDGRAWQSGHVWLFRQFVVAWAVN